ncbi:hypothetical protein HNQ94_003016 [Salirhabdus euzebyi]|uniref:Uncharacterized protein n=1 Tax=Salirhabdus euzebyi TaxID=394506 RepID=A0A841Q8B7_9BACI|nr:hypothetical protein [Salirhabdus euzebyi]
MIEDTQWVIVFFTHLIHWVSSFLPLFFTNSSIVVV